MASGAKADLKESLGPELSDLNISELDPRTFVKRNLLDPIDDEVTDVRRSVGDRSRRPRGRPGGNPATDDEGSKKDQPAPPPTFDSDTT